MGAPESARGPSGVAPAGVRTTLAVGLLALGVGDLAAIHGVFLPRYLASRSHGTDLPAIVSTTRAPVPSAPVAAPSPPAGTHAPVAGVGEATEAPPTPAAAVAEPAPLQPAPAAAVPDRGQAPEAASPAAEPDRPHLFFARNTAWLSPESRETLARLAERLKEDPSLGAMLEGHTDDLGAPELNRSLSLRRAMGAQAWLVESGVDRDRVKVRAFGSSRPAAAGASREARAQNRRVEITIGERSL